jgi:histidine decarboxylase
MEKLRRNKFALEKQYAHIRPIDYYEKPNKYKPIAFFSEDTHYSVIKGVSMCSVTNFAEEGRLQYKDCCPITDDGSWPDEVPSHNLNHDHPNSGTIKVDDLEKLVEFFVKRDYPIIIILNQGSTWKGAYDDVPAVNDMLKSLGKKYPWLWKRTVEYLTKKTVDDKVIEEKILDTRRGFWLHIDGALGASYLPFLRMAQNRGELSDKKVPEFDFSIDAVMSIVCSMHKWIGAPWPGGVYMTRRRFQLSPPDTAGYIGSPDTTLGGSRNGFSPILFWKYFAKNGYKKNIKRALKTEQVAANFEMEIKELERELQKRFPEDKVDLWIHRSELSLAVLFRKVNADITYKYTVDSERITVPFEEDGKKYYEDRTYSHIYSMTSLGKYNLVKQLIGDIRKACKHDWKDAFPDSWEENGNTIRNPGKRHKLIPAITKKEKSKDCKD